MRQTSLDAYNELRERLGEMENIVYYGFKQFGLHTDREMTEILGLSDPNKIRPRRNNLFKKGLLKEYPKRKCSVSGKTSIVWGI